MPRPPARPAPVLALVVNPVAGMGGAVALKGTDGVLEEAHSRGALPVAHGRAVRFLRGLAGEFRLLTCSGPMGEDACREVGHTCEVVVAVRGPTSARDTQHAAVALRDAGASLVCFVGGDGTALDVARAVGHSVPCLGVPSGVKMSSAVFAGTPEAASEVAAAFARGETVPEVREVVEVDEDALRAGEVRPAQLASLLVPRHEAVQSSKAEPGGTLDSVVEAVVDLAAPGRTLVLGPGSTVLACKRALVGDGTLLGVDVVLVGPHGGATLEARDATAADLARVPDDALVVVSPIGGQGFVLGRGNQQITADLVRRVGWERFIVVATAEKVRGLGALYVDSGDPGLDADVPAHLPVVTGPGFRSLVRVNFLGQEN